MPPEVTAIVTCMTDAERPFLRETLQSVQNQTVPCRTIVVALESNTWIDEILLEFPAMELLRRPPGFLGAVRNDGIQATNTAFVAFLDGDDIWLSGKTELQLKYLLQNSEQFVASDHMLMREEGTDFAYALARHISMPSSWMVSRQTMLQYPFDPTANGLEDYEWWMKTWHTVRKCRIPEVGIRYRVRETSMSSATSSKRRKLAFARLSTLPAMRPILLAATHLLHTLTRKSHYQPAKNWPPPPAPETAANP
jgi:glycosyltransferase involved in cell wall biosynthesis